MDNFLIYVNISGEIQNLKISPAIDSEEMLIVCIASSQKNEELFRQKHRVSDVQGWLLEAKQHLEERCPTCLKRDGGNLMEDIENFYKNSSEEYFDECADSLFDYRVKHDLRFAFRGCNVPSVLIEKNGKKFFVYYRDKEKYVSRQVTFDCLCSE